MRTELQVVLKSLQDLPAEELPRLLGELEEIRATAMMRLSVPAQPKPADQLLDVTQAAERLGMSRDYVYRHADEYSFTRRNGRALRFSAQGIEKHLRQLDSKTARR
jgi:excisionase family DNA binding protein